MHRHEENRDSLSEENRDHGPPLRPPVNPRDAKILLAGDSTTGVTSCGQEAAPVLSCARPVHRTGRLFVEMPFETPGDDMSQDVSYCRVHRSRTSPIAGPTGDGNPPVVLLR